MRTSRFLRRELCEIIAIDRVRSVALILVFFSLLIFVPLQSAAQSSAHQTPEIRIIVVETQTEAAQILERLQAGEDFATLAREKSIDPSSSNGGSLGGLDPAALRTELRDAVRGAGKGQLAGPVKISTGFAILKVEDSSAAAASTPPAPTAGAAQGGAAVAKCRTPLMCLARSKLKSPFGLCPSLLIGTTTYAVFAKCGNKLWPVRLITLGNSWTRMTLIATPLPGQTNLEGSISRWRNSSPIKVKWDRRSNIGSKPTNSPRQSLRRWLPNWRKF